MTREEEYQLSLYQDMGAFNEKERVHLLRHRLNGKICVQKRVSASLLRIYRFLEETKNPYIPEIYACIPDGDELIIIEEYIEGRTLADIIRESREEPGFAGNREGVPRTEQAAQGNSAGQMHSAGKTAEGHFAGKATDREILSEELTAQIGVSLCRALRPLHNAEPMIICRDIKAENIIIENPSLSGLAQSVSRSTNEALWPEREAEAGRAQSASRSTNEALWPEKRTAVACTPGSLAQLPGGNFSLKIVDFNISRQVKAGQTKDTQFMGTAQYAAPEQYGFLQTDNRTDIFSIGVLMNYCRTGEFPPDQTADGALGEIIRKCTALDPADRYPRAEDLEQSLLPLCGIRSAGQCGASGKDARQAASSGLQEHPGQAASPGPQNQPGQTAPSGPRNPSGQAVLFESQNLFGKTDSAESLNLSPLQEPRRPAGLRRAVLAENPRRIPGFRSGRPRNMLIACAGYLFLTALCFSVDPSTAEVPLPSAWKLAEQFVFWCFTILFVFLVCNYRGLWNKLHLPAKKDGKPRLWACIILYVVLFFLWTLLCVVFEAVFLQAQV